MNDKTLDSPKAIESFLRGARNVNFSLLKKKRYAWIASVLKRTEYPKLTKREKGMVREYIQCITGYSRAQSTRLITQYQQQNWIGKKVVKRHTFVRQYTQHDIHLLVETDAAHQTLSGALTKKLFERAYLEFEDQAYKRLSGISISHLYNLRKSSLYQAKRRHLHKTQRSAVSIGERRKPKPNGCPGYIRIDTVHQGDQDKEKGVYHINAVDEVTQYEVVCSVEKISERFLIPVLEQLLNTFPFKIKNFHSDNGSEYINVNVAKLLNKLFIEFTKSRARHSNDNALVESKNGAIVRKVLGYEYIPQKYAPLINEFNQQFLVPYINFHRPCYFAQTIKDSKGKEKKAYPYKNVMTPYEKLKSLPHAKDYLKSHVTFEKLDEQASCMTDLEAAKALQKARKKLFVKCFSTASIDNV